MFTLVQSGLDVPLLESICDTLGVGVVSLHDALQGTWRFRVEKSSAELLNGNMVLV